MSLTASMWTGVSGLKGHGNKMGVIGNNIANVSTLGFKGSRMHFEDFMSQTVGTASGPGQVGRGVAVGAIMGDFSQGSLETTNESTDVAITGNGFFMVSPPAQEINYYSRAGNFRFDNEGFYVDPHGYRVQGWQMEDGTIVGAPGDVQLDNFQSPPAETKNLTGVFNLDSSTERAAVDYELWGEWDGEAIPPLGTEFYSYQSTTRVYDENGRGHNMTVYFQQREPDPGAVPPEPESNKVWQFIATVPPDSDLRDVGDDEKGLLFHGELVFNAAGQITRMQNLNSYMDTEGNPAPADIEWRDGKPLVVANFTGADPADADFDGLQGIELDFGLTATLDDADPPAVTGWTPSALATTSFASGSTTLYQSQDGYTAGFLQNVSVNREGVMTGRYSNGQVEDLFTLTIGDFNNVWGLRREGGNLFAETRDSGPAFTGIATTGRFGTVVGNSLELSNVDLATEFVKMISTQKGFQANSKTITTVDMMLDEVIRMKR